MPNKIAPRPRLGPPLVAAFAVVFAACGPEPIESFDEFVEKTEDQRPEPGETGAGMLAPLDGEYLMVLSSVVDPAHPLQFLDTATSEISLDGLTGTLTLEFQPLSLDPQCLLGPRQPVGEAILLEDLPVDLNGAFLADLGTQMVTGEANPITGSDITATLALSGFVQNEDLFCGTVTGDVTAPIQAPLDGSTFAAIKVDGVDNLPDLFPMRCEDAMGDDGTLETVPEC